MQIYVKNLPPTLRGLPLGDSDPTYAIPALVGPQPPILPLSWPRTGFYKAARNSAADGSCGTHAYPCYHPGLDVLGAQGTTVRAPENGTVVFLADGSAAPWVGYGPFLVLIKGSSYYHLLAHLQPGTVTVGVGQAVTAGDPIGQTSSAAHTHWEVRRKVTPDYASGETNLDNNLDPMDWLAGARGGKILLALALGGGAVALALYLRRRQRRGG